ncbi:MAG: class I SAM-dependent methyltransferase [Victivallales bacterium]|nr:class I SAM-dependent methyltransferase [Victivallales bacterium]
MSDLDKRIKDANRAVYNDKSPEQYNRNESIFNPRRENACRTLLSRIATISGDDAFLDVGTGTGNILRIGRSIFKRSYGSDIGDKLLGRVAADLQGCHLFSADAEEMPIKDFSFNCISCYAMLHHLLSHEKILRECHRMLKPGGTLYTDHDPNYFFNRFYHILYRLRHSGRPGFGSDMEELAEYHNTLSSGINPEKLKKLLLQIGFNDVKVTYRMTDRTAWPPLLRPAVASLRLLTKIIPIKSLFTHFMMTAVK